MTGEDATAAGGEEVVSDGAATGDAGSMMSQSSQSSRLWVEARAATFAALAVALAALVAITASGGEDSYASGVLDGPSEAILSFISLLLALVCCFAFAYLFAWLLAWPLGRMICLLGRTLGFAGTAADPPVVQVAGLLLHVAAGGAASVGFVALAVRPSWLLAIWVESGAVDHAMLIAASGPLVMAAWWIVTVRRPRRLLTLCSPLVAMPLLVLGGYMDLVIAMFVVSPLCANTELRRERSPDGALEAVVFERNCGATTGFTTHVGVMRAGEPVEVALPTSFASVDGMWPQLSVRWTDGRSLALVLPVGEEVYRRESVAAEGVQVTYE